MFAQFVISPYIAIHICVFYYPGRQRKPTRLHPNLRSQPIRQATWVRLLGVILDSHLSWRKAVGYAFDTSTQRLYPSSESPACTGLSPKICARSALRPCVQPDTLRAVNEKSIRHPIWTTRGSRPERYSLVLRRSIRGLKPKSLIRRQSLPLLLVVSRALFIELLRLSEFLSGKTIIRRLRNRHKSHFSDVLSTLVMFVAKSRNRRQRGGPPWMSEDISYELCIPGLKSKRSTPLSEARYQILVYLHAKYREHLHVYTMALIVWRETAPLRPTG